MPSKDCDSPGSEAKEALAYYKSQIQQLESELADFQASSKELEQELEKELEASEKQHRDLRNKNEGLRYEVEEWKNKYKQSKTEANSAQNTLQKEVTNLRETNRQISLRLRDIEVSNDDFERQERIVKSSLEDMESKYNQAIERGVLLEEEIKIGEQEREGLRIECQRLRDELSDLKVEQDITVDKLNNAMAMAAKYGNGSLHHVPPPAKFQSTLSETSSVASRPPSTPTTPSAASTSTPQSDHSPTPPSPPMSEVSTTPSQPSRAREDPALTPRPKRHQRPAHSRAPSFGSHGPGMRPPIPSSKSLHHIRGLIGQMQRLEQRVQHARSKLPGPVSTPPRISPRNQGAFIPPTVTMRSQKKHRPSSISSVTSGGSDRDTVYPHGTRLSFGERPSSRATSRPSSRASGATSRSSLGSQLPQSHRPSSRASLSGRVTPMETHSEFGMTTINVRDRTSIGSVASSTDDTFPAPAIRRNTVAKGESGIPLPASGLPRRSFGGRRISSTSVEGEARRRLGKKLSGVGEA
ncbi:NUDE protein [Tuber indicum]|nr:NUDE protein [Tuber indicum]